jgi:Flp pilus assembly protein TadD
MGQGRLADAIAALKTAVGLQSSDASAEYQLAVALRKAGKPEEARSHFEKAARAKRAKSDFEQAGSHTVQGISALRAGKPMEAVRALREAVQIKPDYPEANYYLGIALAQTGMADEAVRAFEAALARKPYSAELHYNFGIALWQMQRQTDAIVHFQRAIELNPEDALAECALGKAKLRIGENAEGEAALKRARARGVCLAP